MEEVWEQLPDEVVIPTHKDYVCCCLPLEIFGLQRGSSMEESLFGVHIVDILEEDLPKRELNGESNKLSGALLTKNSYHAMVAHQPFIGLAFWKV